MDGLSSSIYGTSGKTVTVKAHNVTTAIETRGVCVYFYRRHEGDTVMYSLVTSDLAPYSS